MTPKERAIAALNLQKPDEVPTFELEFQLAEEMFGKKFADEELREENLNKLSQKEREKTLYEAAEYMTEVYTKLEYCIIPGYGPSGWEDLRLFHKYLKEMIGNNMMIGHHGDGTFSIPDGNDMYTFAYQMADDPEGLKKKAEDMANAAIERNKRLQENGVDCLLLCSDYCYNSGPEPFPKK